VITFLNLVVCYDRNKCPSVGRIDKLAIHKVNFILTGAHYKNSVKYICMDFRLIAFLFKLDLSLVLCLINPSTTTTPPRLVNRQYAEMFKTTTYVVVKVTIVCY